MQKFGRYIGIAVSVCCLLAETIKSGGKHSLPTQLRDILTNMTIYCKIGLIIQRGLNTIVLSSGSAKK